jgi:tetratricopeptide (TPR) repeat protein
MQLKSIVIGTTVLFGSAFGLAAIHGGTPPTQVHAASMSQNGGILIEKLREATSAAPDDLASWKALANALGEELKKADFESPDLSLEMVDVLSNVLRLEPNDPQALITLANLAFNQRAFTKSAELYQRYLQTQPSDLLARASLGSSYTFLKKFDDAERELLAVLKSDPRQFQGLAYISILYAEKGDKVRAIEFGGRAVDAAPVEEARVRFTVFLDKLKGISEEPKAPATQKVSFDDYVRNHPILGPKLVALKADGQLHIIELKNFPIAAMPPMAKDKLKRDMLPLLPAGSKVKLVDLDNGLDFILE